jgi:hypothetical protein
LHPDSLLSKLLALTLVLAIGFYLTGFNSRYIILKERSLLPAFFFVMIVSSIISLQRLHPVIPAMVLLIIALDKLLSSYKTERLSYNFFEAAFFIGAGSLLYFHLIWFVFLVWIALLILRPVIWREWMFSILGVFLPLVFYSAGYFLLNDTFEPVIDVLTVNFTASADNNYIFLPEIIFFSFLLLLIIFASRNFLHSMAIMKILPRKIFLLFFWMWFLSVVVYTVVETANIELLMPAAIPVSFLLSHYILSIRSKFWGNFILWAIIAGLQILVWLPVIIA